MMTSTNAPPTYVAAPQPFGQQQTVTVQPAPQPRSGNWKGILWTGVIQICLGSMTAICGIVTLVAFKPALYINDFGSPIWCGILFYVVAGILGTVSGSKKNSGVAIGYMVMSILACLATCCVIGFAVVWMLALNSICYPRYYPYGSYYYHDVYYPDGCYLKPAVYGVYGTLIVLAIVEFIVAIVGASMTCGPICNGGSATQTVIHYQARPQMVVTTQPQGPAFYNISAGQQQVGHPAQQGQYLQAEAPQPASKATSN